MRLDIYNDPNNPLNQIASVYLNGEPQNLCTVADEENGYIWRFKEKRNPMTDEWEQEQLFGQVTILIPHQES
jgi:hypothetical protein